MTPELHRACVHIRDLVASIRLHGPLNPYVEEVARAATEFVDRAMDDGRSRATKGLERLTSSVDEIERAVKQGVTQTPIWHGKFCSCTYCSIKRVR